MLRGSDEDEAFTQRPRGAELQEPYKAARPSLAQGVRVTYTADTSDIVLPNNSVDTIRITAMHPWCDRLSGLNLAG